MLQRRAPGHRVTAVLPAPDRHIVRPGLALEQRGGRRDARHRAFDEELRDFDIERATEEAGPCTTCAQHRRSPYRAVLGHDGMHAARGTFDTTDCATCPD